MVNGMYIVVNVMLSLMSPPPALCKPIDMHGDDICMCVVNRLLEFVFDSVYADLQYDELSLTFTAGSLSLCCVCSHVVVFGMSVSWYPMWML